MTIDKGAGPTSQDDVARLKSENLALRTQVEQMETATRHSGRIRAIAVGVLIALSAVAFAGAIVGVWARRSISNQDVFTDRVGPLAQDPAVQALITARLTDEIMTLVDPQALFEEALPDRGRILAVPLTSAVQGFVNDQVASFVASDTFARLWTEAVRRAHDAVRRVLNGQSEIVSDSGDSITVNFIPVIDAVLERIDELSPQLFGRTIDVPTLTADDIPDVAREKLSAALGQDLSPEFGVIEIQGTGDALASAQQGVRIFNLALWVLLVALVVLLPLTLWLSRRRRRTLLQLTVALTIVTVIVRRVVITLQADALEQVATPNRDAVNSVTDRFVDPLLSSTTIVLWILVAILVVTVVTGPYTWAVSLRDLVRRLFSDAGSALGAVKDATVDDQAERWLRRHSGTLQAVGVGVALLVLLAFDLSWFGLVVVLLLLAGYLACVWWVTSGSRAQPSSQVSPTGPPAART